MTDPENKKLILFFCGLGLGVLLLIVVTNALLKLVPSPEHERGGELPEIESDRPPATPGSGGEPKTEQAKPGIIDRRPITYTASGFSPTSVTVRISDEGVGCLITVVNRTDAPLKIGVSPHEDTGDPGADYGFIQPGETGILDVRYLGLSEITLHSHQNPAQEFRVIYGQGCK